MIPATSLGRFVTACALTLLPVVAACGSRDVNPFGPQINDLRRRERIPIIPSDWVADSRHWSWDNPRARDPDFVGHSVKSVVSNHGQLEYETDGYVLAKRYPDRDPDRPGIMLNETIRITYYHSHAKPTGPWECAYVNKDGSHEISLEKAEAILRKDGISRLDYD